MVLKHAGRILLAGSTFYVGTMAGAALAGVAGLAPPELPAGVDQGTLALYLPVSALLVAAVLAPLARRLGASYLVRWLMLAFLAWVTLGVNTALEAAVFSPGQAAIGFSAVTYGVASLACAAVLAKLYLPVVVPQPIRQSLRAFLAWRDAGSWAWRFGAAIATFPAIYLVFGLAVRPLVIEYYSAGLQGLQAPGWGELLPVLFLRSALFLAACFPVLVTWRGSRMRLFAILGGALFMLVGGIYMVQSYWLPAPMRIAHAAEILADSYAYAGALVLLLTKGRSPKFREPDSGVSSGP